MVALDFEKLTSRGHVTVVYSLPNAFLNWKSPTATELNNALNLSSSISWNDYSFGVQASNTNSDPSFADVGDVEDRGASQYGGDISFFFPKENDDNSNDYSVVQDAVQGQRVRAIITVRIDGDKLTTQPFAAGDYVSQYQVLSDGEADVITGEEKFRYTMTYLQNGGIALYTVVRATTNTVVVTPATAAVAVGDVARLKATINGREYTNGVVWSSSDTAIATVSNAGVYTAIAAGSATITAKDPYTVATATSVLTIS